MAGRPLRPAKDRRLGKPLPYQQTNLTQAHPIVKASKERPSFPLRAYAVLIRVSSGYPPLQGRFLRVTHPFAARQHKIQQAESKMSVTARLACIKPTASVQSEP